MDTLTTLEKATVDDAANHALPAGSFSVTSSDTAVATVNTDGGFWYCFGQTAGTSTLTATRNADGATATLDITVTTPALPGFTIQLGAHSAK